MGVWEREGRRVGRWIEIQRPREEEVWPGEAGAVRAGLGRKRVKERWAGEI